MDTEIFATRSDLMVGLKRIESQKDLHYAICDLLKTNETKVLNSLLHVEEVGYNTTGQYITGIQFLVVEKKYKIKTRSVKQKKGGYLYAVDPLENPHSIIFQPNGIYDDSCLIKGVIGTVSESKKSIELYHFFRREIIVGFKKIKGCYIGPDAMKLAQSSVRLITMHVQQPPEYDLTSSRLLKQ